MEVAREIVETVTDPSAMIGPEVCTRYNIVHVDTLSAFPCFVVFLLFIWMFEVLHCKSTHSSPHRLVFSMTRCLETMLPSRRRRKGCCGSKSCITLLPTLPLHNTTSGFWDSKVFFPTSFLGCPRSTSLGSFLIRKLYCLNSHHLPKYNSSSSCSALCVLMAEVTLFWCIAEL